MKVKVLNITIVRDKMTRVPKQIFAWELPVWQEKFPVGMVIVESEDVREIAELPKPDVEFGRMLTAFGVESDTNIPFVFNAFGRGKAGLDALAKEMKASQAKAKRTAKKATAKKPQEPEPTAPEPEDPLA
jgi:hypothetical protein